jgi:hypothetical protein
MKRLSVLALVVLSACTVQQADKGNSPTAGGDTKPPADEPGAPADPADPKPQDPKPGDPPAQGDGTTRVGSVTLTQMTFQAGPTTINSFSASAAFVETTATGTATCKTSTEGDCTISECTIPQGGGGAPQQPTSSPHAGEIKVAATGNVTLTPDAKGVYAAKTGQTELFKAGADISVKAAGDKVPAFDKTVKGPSIVTVTAPTWPAAGQPFQVDRTKAIDLVWKDGTAGDVTASVSSLAGDKSATVMCKFAANANKGTIPAAALGKLVVTAQGSISVSASSTVAFDQGDWKLSLTAFSPAKAGTAMASGIANVK